MTIKERNLAVSIILSIVTCGIYGLYWFVKLTDETKYLTGTDGADGIVALLLTLVTCGIYGWYWNYKLGERVDMLKKNRGQESTSSPVHYNIQAIYGHPKLNYLKTQTEYVIAQSELNNYANA